MWEGLGLGGSGGCVGWGVLVGVVFDDGWDGDVELGFDCEVDW